MIKVSLIPTAHVERIWPDVKPFMERAAEYTYGRYTVDDIKDSITQYEHLLWIAFDDEGIKGATVTAFKNYPKMRCLDLVFCGGDDGLEWKAEMLRVLQHWAFDNSCDEIECSGRLGWAKIFKDDGYRPLWQTYTLPIATSGLGV